MKNLLLFILFVSCTKHTQFVHDPDTILSSESIRLSAELCPEPQFMVEVARSIEFWKTQNAPVHVFIGFSSECIPVRPYTNRDQKDVAHAITIDEINNDRIEVILIDTDMPEYLDRRVRSGIGHLIQLVQLNAYNQRL